MVAASPDPIAVESLLAQRDLCDTFLTEWRRTYWEIWCLPETNREDLR